MKVQNLHDFKVQMWWLVDNFKHNPDYERVDTPSGLGGQFIAVIPKLNIVGSEIQCSNINELLMKSGVENYQ